jgi:hypothetical protein
MPVGWNCTNSMSCSGRPCARHHAAAVAGAGVGGGGGEIGAAIAAGGQHDHLGAEDMDRAVVELPGHDADALPVFGHQIRSMAKYSM